VARLLDPAATVTGRFPPGKPFLPDGQINSFYRNHFGDMSSLAAKNIPLPFFVKVWLHAAIPPRHEGRCGQSSRNVGRNAMDVAARLTKRGRSRTAKSCGPDTPTLVSSLSGQKARGEGG
jgi:hypothetical protein